MKPCVHCSSHPHPQPITIDGIAHNPQCIVAVAARGGSVLPFSGAGKVIMRGAEFVARARSATMARRIANALNQYKPNKAGF